MEFKRGEHHDNVSRAATLSELLQPFSRDEFIISMNNITPGNPENDERKSQTFAPINQNLILENEDDKPVFDAAQRQTVKDIQQLIHHA